MKEKSTAPLGESRPHWGDAGGVRPARALQSAVMTTAATVLVMWVARWAISSLGEGGVARLAVTAGAGGLAYVVGLAWFGGPVRWELRTLAGWVVRPGPAVARAK